MEFERRSGPLDASLRRGLERHGYTVDDGRDDLGSGQAIAIDPDSGTRTAAADWRRESVAVAY